MAKKRKSVATSLDEVDRNMYSTFSSTAKSLSQLYTQAMNQQKLSFEAGERHGLEKLYHWIFRQQEGGSRVATIDVINYLQNELDCSGEEPPVSPPPQQHLHPAQFGNSDALGTSRSSGAFSDAQAFRSETCDLLPDNCVFSNAIFSPVRRSLQDCQISQGSYFQSNAQPSTNGNWSSETNTVHQQSMDPNIRNPSDNFMDTYAE